MQVLRAVNWNKPEDELSLQIWTQQMAQFWLEHDVPVSKDLDAWSQLSEHEKDVYKKVLGGLTLLDTTQGGLGMPAIAMHIEQEQARAVLVAFGLMEQIHAKSYSHIFTTLITQKENDEVFEWANTHPLLQYKANRIAGYYRALRKEHVSKKELYMSMVASVFLESFLFYSGFFYPLYLYGQGKMTSSGEIIRLILRDEAIHGAYVGWLAQKVYKDLAPEEQAEVDKEVQALLMDLYSNEMKYTEEIYHYIGLVDEVVKFIQYNADRALMNLGLAPQFEPDEINPIVENGLSTQTIQHDFFSVKGNGYFKAVNVEPLRDEDFIFE